MQRYTAHLVSSSAYAQGHYHNAPKLERELHDAYEERTVYSKMHTTPDGDIFIPPMAFKKCLEDTARYLKMQIPGRGKETYTKNFVQGVICSEPVFLRQTKDDAYIEKVFTLSQPGKANGGRVWKYFPVLKQWEGDLDIFVVDEMITKDILQKHLNLGGQITGVGVWRPQRGGMWGKFSCTALTEQTV